jgi:hypothetical protein
MSKKISSTINAELKSMTTMIDKEIQAALKTIQTNQKILTDLWTELDREKDIVESKYKEVQGIIDA